MLLVLFLLQKMHRLAVGDVHGYGISIEAKNILHRKYGLQLGTRLRFAVFFFCFVEFDKYDIVGAAIQNKILVNWFCFELNSKMV